MRHVEKDDFQEINLWREQRQAPILSQDFYPQTGLIVDGIAAGFLTMTDTKVALMENFITNPKAYKEDRENAVFEILEGLEKIAVQMGFKYVVGFTDHPKIEHYAKMIGGTAMNYKVYGKELNYGTR